MSIIEVLIIALASAMEIASIVICKGAMFSKVSKDKIGKMLLIVVGWNVLTLMIGNAFAYPLVNWDQTMIGKFAKGFFVILIFVSLSVWMLVRSFRNNFMDEVRNDILKWSDTFKLSSLSGITSALVGFGFGLIGTNLILQLVVFAISSILAVICGIFIGYRFGYHPKRKGYIFSAALLLIIDIELIIDFVRTIG
ncbi:MAG: manganese efflux pump [Lachnospiraceae bacterium]|nr:manganese efflux pump [Lachnospiraceae bacterium]